MYNTNNEVREVCKYQNPRDGTCVLEEQCKCHPRERIMTFNEFYDSPSSEDYYVPAGVLLRKDTRR